MNRGDLYKGAITLLIAIGLISLLLWVQGFKVSYASSAPANVAASLTVPSSCGISLGTSAINFGSLNPGANTVTTANAVTDTNSAGNAGASLWVYGGRWNGCARR